MDERHLDWDRLTRYVTRQGTPEDLEALEQWVRSNPELAAVAESMRTIGRPPESPAHAWDTRSAWHRLQGRIRRLGRPPLQVTETGARIGAWEPWWRRIVTRPVRAAAAVLLLVGGGSLVAVRSGWLASSPGTVAPATPPMREVATRRGQRAALDLPDGSRVILAAASRLRIPPSYRLASDQREVYLEGEAWFEVQHDRTRPFRVHAANGVAEDLGTEFLVTSYAETRGMQVVVASGAVALRTADTLRAQPRALLTLVRGDLARLDSSGTATLTRGVRVDRYTSWVQGNLAFDGTALGEVLLTLSRWYDVDFRLTDRSLADRQFTATFRDESVEQVLELLARSLDLRVARNGRSVVLSPGGRPQRSP